MSSLVSLALTFAAVAQGSANADLRYLARFEAALQRFDAGDFDTAEAGFTQAGEDAPDAPVWRVSAGVAAARAGRADVARARFEEALALGYPVSDLAALHELGAAVASGLDDVALEGAVAPSLAGLRELPGDARHIRDLVVAGEPLGPVTHVVGRLCYEHGRRVPRLCARLSHFRVDFDQGSIVHLVDRERTDDLGGHGSAGLGLRGGNDLETALPRPRGPAFLRMLRSGLLVDDDRRVWQGTYTNLVALDLSEGRRIVHVRWPGNWRPAPATAIDLTRFTRCDAASVGERSQRAPLAVDAALVGRAREWFDAAHHAGVRVYTLPAIGEGGQAALLAVFRGELPKDVHPPSLRILSADAAVVLTEVELDSLVPRHGEYAWMGVGEPVLAPEAGRLLIAHRSKSTILAFDCADWSLAWHEHVPWGGQELEVRGELLFTSADNGEDDCDVRDVRTGAVRFVGTPLGLGRVLGDAEGALLVGQGRDALHVFGPEALQSDPLGTEPLWSLWPHGDEVVVVACDGTWALPSAALDPLARVRFGDRLVAAQPLARWLLDPLHVRSFAADVDPAPRRVPLR